MLKVVEAVLGTGALVALATYAWLAYRSDSRALYGSANPSRWSRIFLAMAAIGFLVCIYQGAEAMLSWMPYSWGGEDEDGGHQRLSVDIAMIFAGTVGIVLISVLDGVTRSAFSLRDMKERARNLEEMLAASLNLQSLGRMRSDFEENIAKLGAEWQAIGDRSVDRAGRNPEEPRIRQYRELIVLVDRQMERLQAKIPFATPDVMLPSAAVKSAAGVAGIDGTIRWPSPTQRRKAKPTQCPVCGSTKIADILYGQVVPSDDLDERVRSEEIVLGGCVMVGNDPLWECAGCGARLPRDRDASV